MKPLSVRILLITSLITFVLITTATPQEAAANASLAETAAGGYATETRIPDLLHQFNGSLQALAARVSPAVVQITVTGFGPQDDKSKDGTSFIVRQRAIGSGVILDPNGYITTNAHVVEGAHRFVLSYHRHLPIPRWRLSLWVNANCWTPSWWGKVKILIWPN